MSSGRRVGWLAQKAGLRPEEAIRRLQEAGIRVGYPHEQVSQQDLPRVRVLLGLDDPSHSRAVPTPIIPTLTTQPIHDGSLDRSMVEHELSRKRQQQQERRTIIGPPVKHMKYLTADIVEKVHYVLVEDFLTSGDPIDPPGCRDGRAYLESALSRPTTSLGGELKYPTIQMAAAALLHALVHDHPFYNGNKRTAIVSLLVFLDSNGYILTATQDELYDYVWKLAGHNITETSDADSEMLETARWIHKLSREKKAGEKRLRYRELFIILRSYGCEYEVNPGNSLAIYRGDLSVSVRGYRNDGKHVEPETLGRIRKSLELDDGHGIDSEVFYYSGSRIPKFINDYRQTLKRLAYL